MPSIPRPVPDIPCPGPGKYIEVEPGVRIHYEDRGEGDPIVFIPGWTFTTEVYRNQMDYFSQTHRAIAIDPRSQGRSTVTVNGNNYETHGEDLIKIIETLNLRNVVLVGWSAGCASMWEYFKQQSTNRLKGMIFIDLPVKLLSCNPEDWVEGSLDQISSIYTTYMKSSQGQQDFIEVYTKDVMLEREPTPEELRWIVEQSLKTPYQIASILFAFILFSNYFDEAKQIDQSSLPALYIIGRYWKDIAVPYMEKHFPNTTTEVLGGHMMFWEYPEKFNCIVEKFLNSL